MYIIRHDIVPPTVCRKLRGIPKGSASLPNISCNHDGTASNTSSCCQDDGRRAPCRQPSPPRRELGAYGNPPCTPFFCNYRCWSYCCCWSCWSCWNNHACCMLSFLSSPSTAPCTCQRCISHWPSRSSRRSHTSLVSIYDRRIFPRHTLPCLCTHQGSQSICRTVN